MRSPASLWSPALALVLASSAACDEKAESTEVIVIVDIEPSLAERSATLRVRVYDTDGALALDEERAVPDVELPLRVPLVPSPSGEGERSYHVVASLTGPSDEPLGTQRVIGGYVEGQSRILKVLFTDACAGEPCAGDETCRAADGAPECVPGCFEPQESGSTALPEPQACSRVIWVDGARGADHSSACLGPDAPCENVQFVVDTYLTDGRGGVVNVAGGSSYGRVVLRNEAEADNGGTAESPTVIRAWPGTGRPVFGSGESFAIGTCCTASSANHFVLEGLEVDGAVETGIHIHGENVDSAEVRDCVVRGVDFVDPVRFPTQSAGITITNQPRNVVLRGNRIEANDAVGTAMEDGSPAPVHGISITNTRGGMVIEGNVIVDNGGHGIYVGDRRTVIRGNRVVRSGGAGIQIINAGELMLEDNWICEPAGAGLDIVNADDNEVRHNTVVGSAAQGLLLTSFSMGNLVVGNLFAFNAGAAIERDAEAGDPEDRDNLLWMNGDDLAGVEPDGTVWLDVEPVFRDRGSCDLVLVQGSEATELVDGGPVGSRVPDAD